MQWIQFRAVGGQRERFARYKCNRCGITAEVASSDSAVNSVEEGLPLPQAWRYEAERGGRHLCPQCASCDSQRRKIALPVVGAVPAPSRCACG